MAIIDTRKRYSKKHTFRYVWVLLVTYIVYASFHASGKPPSIVKSILSPESSGSGWAPFDAVDGKYVSDEDAARLSTYFDYGGLCGGVLAGHVSDRLEARAITSVMFTAFSIPVLLLYRKYGGILLMFASGMGVNGPYSLITTAVAADLGGTQSLASVTAIIDGSGSFGAALYPSINWIRIDLGMEPCFSDACFCSCYGNSDPESACKS